MRVYNMILLAMAALAVAQEETGTKLTSLATVEVEAPTVTVQPSETVGTTDAPAATDTEDVKSGEFEEDDAETDDVGTVVGGNEEAANFTTPEELPAEFKGHEADATKLDEEDPPESAQKRDVEDAELEDEDTDLEARWRGHHQSWKKKTRYAWGPRNVWNLRFAIRGPYYSRPFGGGYFGWRRILHVDLYVWKRKGSWRRPYWRKIVHLQGARYTHRRKECGFVYDKIRHKALYNDCKWWTWSQMCAKICRVMLRYIKTMLIHAGWPWWLINNVIGTLWNALYPIMMKLRWH